MQSTEPRVLSLHGFRPDCLPIVLLLFLLATGSRRLRPNQSILTVVRFARLFYILID